MTRWIAGVVAGLLLGLSVPVLADHVSEPKNELTSMTVSMFQYGNREATLLSCDGTDRVDFGAMRVHVSLDAVRHGLDPSEHFNAFVSVGRMLVKPNGDLTHRGNWDLTWTHQNTTPHQKSHLGFKFNLWNLGQHFGIWRVEIRVEGLESGNVFEQVCFFEKI